MDREDREIPRHVGEDFAQQHNMYFLETSAKEAENVEKLFMQIAEDLMEVGFNYLKYFLTFKIPIWIIVKNDSYMWRNRRCFM